MVALFGIVDDCVSTPCGDASVVDDNSSLKWTVCVLGLILHPR